MSICKIIEKYMTLIILGIASIAFFVPKSCIWIQTYWIQYFLMIIMFGMGLTLKFDDFKAVFTNPKDVLCGTIAQFTIMPLLAFILGKLFGLNNALFAGVILVGACPGGTASNLITYLAKGDLALSVAITSINTLLAPVLTPFIVYFLLHTIIKISILSMFLSIINVVIIPIILGLFINKFFETTVNKIISYMPAISIFAISIIIASVISHNAQQIANTGLVIFVVVIMHNILGYITGFIFAKLINMTPDKVKAVSIEVGMQNSGLATSLAQTTFQTLPLATVPGAIFSVWHNISGAIIAWFYKKYIKDLK